MCMKPKDRPLKMRRMEQFRSKAEKRRAEMADQEENNILQHWLDKPEMFIPEVGAPLAPDFATPTGTIAALWWWEQAFRAVRILEDLGISRQYICEQIFEELDDGTYSSLDYPDLPYF